jgi:outer membrane protein
VRLFLACATCAILAAAPSRATTLREALIQAYQTNPQLSGGRENVALFDAGVDLAKSTARPTLGAQVVFTETADPLASFRSFGRNVQTGLQAQLPLYRGGAIRSQIRAARRRSEAAGLDLLTLENTVFSNAVAAYEDVRRDREVVVLNQNNVRVLERQLQQSRDRFEVGDLTRTDVAQSEARWALAQANLRSAEAQRVLSEQAYQRIVGSAPAALDPPPPVGELPASPDQSVELARSENPRLASFRKSAEAFAADIGTARAAGRPSLTLNGTAFYQNYLGTAGAAFGVPNGVGVANDFSTSSGGVTLNIPFYTGGQVRAHVNQAKARAGQAQFNAVQVDREVTEQARNAYEALVANRSVVQSARAQVRANEIALEGVRAENSVGLRTIIEVLNAEQELLNSRVQLVRAERDEYVSGFLLLAALGRANADALDLTGTEPERYNPPAPSGPGR